MVYVMEKKVRLKLLQDIHILRDEIYNKEEYLKKLKSELVREISELVELCEEK